jgi:hypothetical protein
MWHYWTKEPSDDRKFRHLEEICTDIAMSAAKAGA